MQIFENFFCSFYLHISKKFITFAIAKVFNYYEGQTID